MLVLKNLTKTKQFLKFGPHRIGYKNDLFLFCNNKLTIDE